jgi:hypothetical protein
MPSELFEQKIRDKVNEARMVPPAEVWQAIEGQIAPQPSRRRPLWWWLGGSGLLGAILLASWLSWPSAFSTTDSAEVPPALASTAPASPERETERVLPGDPLDATSTPAPSPVSATTPPTDQPHRPTAILVPPSDFTPARASRPASVPPVHASALVADRVSATVATSPEDALALRAHTETPQPLGSLATGLIGQVPTMPANLSAKVPAASQAPKLSFALAEQGRPSPSPWSFRASVQPEWAGRGSLRNFAADPSVDHSLLETDSRLIRPNVGQVYTLQYPRRSLSLNLGVGYRLGPRWEVVSGLSLMRSEIGQLQRGTIDLLNLYQDGPRAEEVVQEFDLILHWRQTQLEIPLALSFEALRRGRHRLYLMAGAAADVIINTPIESFDLAPDSEAPTTEPDPIFNRSERSFTTPAAQKLLSLRPWHAHLDARLWYAYQLAPRMQLYLGPTAKYHLRGAYDGLAARDQMKYRLGWELGLRFGQ